MKKQLYTAFILSAFCLSNLAAQDRLDELDDIKDLPKWVVSLSNLSKEKRESYVDQFARAKEAYKGSRWLECLALLNSCEMIFNENPNVLSLKAGCYIEQGDFENAMKVAQESLKINPNDPVLLLNLSSIYLGTAEYEKGIEMLDGVLATVDTKSSQDIYDILLYRKFLCLIMLGQEVKARELVNHTRPMDETPLYYFTQGALYLVTGNKLNAKRELDSADRIFANYPLLRAYHKGLLLSGAIEKFSP